MQQEENILQTIVRQKKREVALLPEREWTGTQMKALGEARPHRRDFAAALKRPPAGQIALIAEVKKASPSAGVICRDFDPVRIARIYEEAGASCLSVLTDGPFFQGALEYLREIRQAVRLPLLRKDFIIDERQIAETVEWGADAVLLIVSILSEKQLGHFHALAAEAGLAVLVEVHDSDELHRALRAGATLIGVNNRDLKTFKVDLATTEALAALIHDQIAAGEILLVAESGIHSRIDVLRLQKAGAKAILVGESLMRQENIPAKINELLDS